MFTGVKRYWPVAAVVVSLVGGGLSWSSAARACTPPAKPDGLRATVNPHGWGEHGILLEWDVAAETDKVVSYQIWRGIGTGGTLIHYADLQSVPAFDTNAGKYIYPPTAPMHMMDPKPLLVSGETYVYAIKFSQINNCVSDLSDTVTAIYETP